MSNSLWFWNMIGVWKINSWWWDPNALTEVLTTEGVQGNGTTGDEVRLDINWLVQETNIASWDFLVVFDVSAWIHRKVVPWDILPQAIELKWEIDASTNPPFPSPAEIGDLYIVTTGWTVGGVEVQPQDQLLLSTSWWFVTQWNLLLASQAEVNAWTDTAKYTTPSTVNVNNAPTTASTDPNNLLYRVWNVSWNTHEKVSIENFQYQRWPVSDIVSLQAITTDPIWTVRLVNSVGTEYRWNWVIWNPVWTVTPDGAFTNNLWFWDANTNTPTILSWVWNPWDFYTVSVAWNTDIDWIVEWWVWDYIWRDDSSSTWQKVSNQEDSVITTEIDTWNILYVNPWAVWASDSFSRSEALWRLDKQFITFAAAYNVAISWDTVYAINTIESVNLESRNIDIYVDWQSNLSCSFDDGWSWSNHSFYWLWTVSISVDWGNWTNIDYHDDITVTSITINDNGNSWIQRFYWIKSVWNITWFQFNWEFYNCWTVGNINISSICIVTIDWVQQIWSISHTDSGSWALIIKGKNIGRCGQLSCATRNTLHSVELKDANIFTDWVPCITTSNDTNAFQLALTNVNLRCNNADAVFLTSSLAVNLNVYIKNVVRDWNISVWGSMILNNVFVSWDDLSTTAVLDRLTNVV